MVQIRQMGPRIGVEVSGVDVRTLDDAGFVESVGGVGVFLSLLSEDGVCIGDVWALVDVGVRVLPDAGDCALQGASEGGMHTGMRRCCDTP